MLGNCLVISAEELYGKFGDALRSLGYTNGDRVYFVLRRPALTLLKIESPATRFRWLPRGPGGIFKLTMGVRGKRHTVRVAVLDLIWNMIPQHVKDEHPRHVIERGVWAVRSEQNYREIAARAGPVVGVALDVADKGKRAAFTFYQPNDQPMTVPVTLDRFLGMADQSLGIIGEVVYIGQTKDDKRHRLDGHEHLQRALAERSDDEQILVLIGRFRQKRLQVDEIGPRAYAIGEFEESEIEARDKLTLIEMALINYFKPPLNDQHKDSPGLRGTVVERSLVKSGYDSVEIHFDPTNPLMFAGSEHAGFKEEHHILYSIAS